MRMVAHAPGEIMRIICSICAQGRATPPPQSILGEKCSRCGSAEMAKLDPDPFIIGLPNGDVFIGFSPRFICWPCRHIFSSGEGGDSHTPCPCHAAEARSAAGLDLAKDSQGPPPKQ